MSAEDWIKPLAVRHKLAMEILGIRGRSYWDLLKEGLIKKVGRGRSSRADYESLELYHRKRLAEAEAEAEAARAANNGRPDPKKSARMIAVRAARGAKKANQETAVE